MRAPIDRFGSARPTSFAPRRVTEAPVLVFPAPARASYQSSEATVKRKSCADSRTFIEIDDAAARSGVADQGQLGFFANRLRDWYIPAARNPQPQPFSPEAAAHGLYRSFVDARRSASNPMGSTDFQQFLRRIRVPRLTAATCEEAPMTRSKVAVLALLSLFLVVDGPRPDASGAASSLESRFGLSSRELSRVIGQANPQLSERELQRIGAAVLRFSAKYELDPELVTAVLLVESGGRPWARSPKGAMGLMQVMPHMLAPLGFAGNMTTIESNVEAGCLILASNIRRLGEEDGISAYFWGSEIRGPGYLQRVRAARAEVRRLLES